MRALARGEQGIVCDANRHVKLSFGLLEMEL